MTKADKLDKEHVPKELVSDKNIVKAIIVKAIEAVDRMFDEEERLVYETRMQSLADVESKIASAEEKGLEQGREAGMNKASKPIALNLLGKGIDVATIAEVTGLAENIIETFLTNRDG